MYSQATHFFYNWRCRIWLRIFLSQAGNTFLNFWGKSQPHISSKLRFSRKQSGVVVAVILFNFYLMSDIDPRICNCEREEVSITHNFLAITLQPERYSVAC